MRSFLFARGGVALAAALLLACGRPAAAGTDSTGATRSTPHAAPPGYTASACAAGFRLATIVRFPIGVGLGLAVCVAGVALDLDARLHRATD